MKTIKLIFLLFLGITLSMKAQNTGLSKEDAINSCNAFLNELQIRGGKLENYKVIQKSVDACFISLETIDYEKQNKEIIKIELPTTGMSINADGEILYSKKIIKEIIKNTTTNEIKTYFYSNSKEVGLGFSKQSTENYSKIQEAVGILSSFCIDKN